MRHCFQVVNPDAMSDFAEMVYVHLFWDVSSSKKPRVAVSLNQLPTLIYLAVSPLVYASNPQPTGIGPSDLSEEIEYTPRRGAFLPNPASQADSSLRPFVMWDTAVSYFRNSTVGPYRFFASHVVLGFTLQIFCVALIASSVTPQLFTD